MHFSNSTLSVLVLLTLILTILVIVVLVPAAVRGGRSRVRKSRLPSGRRVAVLLEEQAKAIERLEGAARKLALGERHLGEIAEESIRHDGVVITSINGRQDTRCYAKRVSGGASAHNLSDEERQAIREALSTGDAGVQAGYRGGDKGGDRDVQAG